MDDHEEDGNTIVSSSSGESILAEYAAIRAEISQLNSQIFTAMTTALTLNVAILGWMFADGRPLVERIALPTFGMLMLLVGTAIILNRNRIAHRLAWYQVYFIESVQPQIRWASTYFRYRRAYDDRAKRHDVSERIAESAVYVLQMSALVNLAILAVVGLTPLMRYFIGSLALLPDFGRALESAGDAITSVRERSLGASIDFRQALNLAIALAIFLTQRFWKRRLGSFEDIRATMFSLASNAGMVGADPLGDLRTEAAVPEGRARRLLERIKALRRRKDERPREGKRSIETPY